MFGRNLVEGRERYGLVSRVLVQMGYVPGAGLGVAWADIVPGSWQRVHDHKGERAYIVLEGRSSIRSGNEEREVGCEDLVHVPSGTTHGIENAPGETLVYFSAAALAMRVKAAYGTGLGNGPDGRERA